MATPNLWSKLEDAGDVTSPDLGTGGAEFGSPTYEPAKFNNGILSDANSEGCTFPTVANDINLDKGTIEFWAKVNFTPYDAASHWLFSFLDGTVNGIRFFFDWFQDGFGVQVYSGSVLKISIFTDPVSFTWNSGDLIHFGITWDREGNDIGGGKTLALYINNVEKFSSTTTWLTGAVNANLYVGTKVNQLSHSDAVIDNLKTHDTCKIDFSDKDTEGVEEELSRTRDIVYDSILELSRTRDIVYDSILELSRTRDIVYDSVLELSRSRDIVYDSILELSISRTRNIIYDLILELSKTKDIVYDSVLELSRTRDIVYDLILFWTERIKPTDTWIQRADTGGPGYDFSMTNIFWDRTDIYFDSTTTGPSQRTKPTDSAT